MTLHNFNLLDRMNSPKPEPFTQTTDYNQNYQSQPFFFEHNDLYDLLLLEPTNLKKPSIHYDYSPNLFSNPSTNQQIPFQLECQSTSKDIKPKSAPVRKCTCSKSQCQKNYCECFRLGLPCTSQCECLSCCNKEKLFARKSSTQKVKCNCQKSKCMKNYCQCHANGSKCGPQCKCTECENIELLEDCLQLQCTHNHGKKKIKLIS